MSTTYVCANCGEENVKGWSDAQAVAEFKARFGREPDPADDVLLCDDCHELIMKWMRTREMTRLQLLDWLSREDSSLYGECKGDLLADLVRDGRVEVGDPPPGRGQDYAPVRLTTTGWAELVEGQSG